MKNLAIILTALIVIGSCSNQEKPKSDANLLDQITETDYVGSADLPSRKLFGIESAHIKFINTVGDMELTREWWFDQYGQRQYEENFMDFMGEKTGSISLYVDGYQYQWNIGSDTGTRMKFFQSATDYQNISKNEMERYGLKILGQERFLGKDCQKVSIEKPAKSTVWIWNNIPLKTEGEFGKMAVLMEATEIVAGNVDGTKFQIPNNINFSDI